MQCAVCHCGSFGMNARDIFIEVLDSVTEESRRLDGSAITDHIATMACKAAVKGNNKLSFKEADTLIEQLCRQRTRIHVPMAGRRLFHFQSTNLRRNLNEFNHRMGE